MLVDAQRAKFWLFSLLLAIVAFTPDPVGADDRGHGFRPFNRIVAFGDSLSDSGNLFALTGGRFVAPPDYGMDGLDSNGVPEVITLIPELAYSSRRLSNGLTWIELLASSVGLGANARPAIPAILTGQDPGAASNYAVAGATAADVGVSPFPLGRQVSLFLGAVQYEAPRDALYVIAIGGNDIRAASADPAVIGMAVQSIADRIRELHKFGARKFLVWNAPDLGRTPALLRLDAAFCPPTAPGCFSGPATNASAGLNVLLSTALQGLGALEGIDIVSFDTFGTLAAVQGNPARYGLRFPATACIQPDVPAFGFPSAAPYRCAEPDRHFFWDGIHPTRAGHAVIAFLVGKALVHGLLADH